MPGHGTMPIGELGMTISRLLLMVFGVATLGLPAASLVQPIASPPAPLEATCSPAQMKGGDVGARINSCDAKLGSNKGVSLLSGAGIISTPVTISSNHTLRVSTGIYHATNNGAVIRLKDNSSLVCDSWDAVLEESTGKNDQAGVKPFTIVTAYNGTSLDS